MDWKAKRAKKESNEGEQGGGSGGGGGDGGDGGTRTSISAEGRRREEANWDDRETAKRKRDNCGARWRASAGN